MLNMKKIVKLTESDLIRIVKRVITEGYVEGTGGIETEAFLNVLKKYIELLPDKKVDIDPIINSTPLKVKGKDKQKVIDVFTYFNGWCLNKYNKIDKEYNKICLKVLYYTKEDQSTIVNLIP